MRAPLRQESVGDISELAADVAPQAGRVSRTCCRGQGSLGIPPQLRPEQDGPFTLLIHRSKITSRCRAHPTPTSLGALRSRISRPFAAHVNRCKRALV